MEKNDTNNIEKGIGLIDTSEMDGKYLTFWTDSQLYGVPISDVVQIVKMQAITEVPDFPYYAKGIINLRGSVTPLVDIRLRLSKNETEYNERTCIIITDINKSNVGFIVDEVDAVIEIPSDHISPPPQISDGNSRFITGVGQLEEKVILLMDTAKIVSNDGVNLGNEEVS